MTHLIIIGFISILGQVALLRELNVASYGIDLVYSLALGIWLLWTACGAYISHKALHPSPARIAPIYLLFSIFLPLDIAFIRSIRILFSNVPGAYLDFGTQIASLLIALLPPGILSGMLFQWAARIYIANGKKLALAYAIESLGGLAGGACSTFFLILGISNFRTALLCSLIPMGAVFIGRTRPRNFLTRPSAAVFGLLALVFWQAPALDRIMTSWTHSNLLETKDSPYGRITIQGSHGQISVFENDALSFETESTEAEEFVQLSALQHPAPKHMLLLGGGIGGAVNEALKQSPTLIDYVELNATLLSSVRAHLPPVYLQPLESAKTRISIADPRRFLAGSARFDLILVNMPEPDSGQSNRFYTREFFQECRSHLNAGGLTAFKLKSSENLWTPPLAQRMVSIYRAAKTAFRDVLVLPGASNIVICSGETLTRDPEAIAQRYISRGIQGKIVSPAYINYLYTNDRFSQIAEILSAGTTPANSDARPVCYQYTAMIWLSKFFPSLASLDMAAIFSQGRIKVGLICGLLTVLLTVLVACRRRRRFRSALLMAIAGFLGMALETLLLLYYQAKNGVLFGDLGILLTSFMAGLAVGAMAVGAWSDSKSAGKIKPEIWGAGILFGFAILGIVAAKTINSAELATITGTSLMTFATGFLVSGIFAYSGHRRGTEQSAAAGPLYAADLIGGCIASLAVGLVLAPLAGLAISATWTAFLSIAAVLFL
jgi:spermidine synthase